MPRSNSIHDNAAAGSDDDSESEIMDEIVRAMSSELRRARGQLDRVHVEKDDLQRELDDVRLQLRAAKEGQEHKGKRGISNSQHDQARREVDRLKREKDEENAEHAKAMEEVVSKLAKQKEKYQDAKAALRESQSVLAKLQDAAASAVAELSGTHVELPRKRKREEDPEEGAGIAESRSNQQPVAPETAGSNFNVTTSRKGQTTPHSGSSKTSSARKSNLRGFLGIVDGEQFVTPSMNHCASHHGQNWDKLMACKTMYCAQGSIIWSSGSAMRCLHFRPAHRYTFETRAHDPCLHDSSTLYPGEVRELFWSDNKNNVYCGTFRCASVAEVPVQELLELRMTERHSLLKRLVKRLQTRGVFVPAHNGSTKADFLRDLYLDGTLLVRCHSLEYVGRNEQVSEVFAQFGSKNSASVNTTVTKSQKKKRQRQT
ncbi:uncharacterized protein B0H18DRAFT_1010183 [Fomitopsis serialis]|uniref:uncharacterized protein n=1 Tax=Fomitopsis serialis TaxID=139415 RepID=UPI002008B8A9|nr:uncharacterized protein B0H18DRAFT_1010183 [Neoantrodia serialis]KAH9925173.1 hypothetical protein B0H18DRAFT_1010183 [Neoantrodia serialis]